VPSDTPEPEAPEAVLAPEVVASVPVESTKPEVTPSPLATETACPSGTMANVTEEAKVAEAAPSKDEPAAAQQIVTEAETRLLLGSPEPEVKPTAPVTVAAPETVAQTPASPPPAAHSINEMHSMSETKPSSARGSLSDFSAASESTRNFQPVQSIDRFELPETCETLLEELAGDFEATTSLIERHAKRGQKLVMIGAAHESAGCTTFVLCLGRALAKRGLKTVMVDYDFTGAMLAASLDLEVEADWLDVLASRSTLAQAVIQATAEPLALLPLAEPADRRPGAETAPRQRLDLGILRKSYDVVLMDAGPVPELSREQLARPGADAAILIHTPEECDPQEVIDAIEQLQSAGMTVLGTVESFTMPEAI
jgi:Mrp family chromosome partitioning ATPase